MADAHMPNDHKDITPGFQPYPFPKVPYLDLFKLEKVSGDGKVRFKGFVPPNYCAGAGRAFSVQGGVSAAISVKAAQLRHQELTGTTALAKPLTIHTEYLRPLPQGAFHVGVDRILEGNRQSCFQVSLYSTESVNSIAACTLAFIRLGDLAGATVTKVIQQPLESIPDRLSDCTRWTDRQYYEANPVTSQVRVYTPNDGHGHLWSNKFGGQNVRYQWFKLDDEGLFRMEHIPFIADLVPALPLSYETDSFTAALQHMIPTMSMNITFRSDVVGDEWLLCRATMKKLQDGLFDMDMMIINDKGDVVATGLQTCAYIPMRKSRVKKQTAKGRL